MPTLSIKISLKEEKHLKEMAEEQNLTPSALAKKILLKHLVKPHSPKKINLHAPESRSLCEKDFTYEEMKRKYGL